MNIEDISVLLVNPPITVPRNIKRRCMPHLGISYIAASLRKHGINVDLLDMVVESYNTLVHNDNLITYGFLPEKIHELLGENSYDIVGITTTFSTDIPNIIKVAEYIKRINPFCKIIVGGLHPSLYPLDILKADRWRGVIDFVFRGEGENSFPEFIRQYMNGCEFSNTFPDNGMCGEEENLDSLPFPAFDLLPMWKYFDINVPFAPAPQGKRVIPILASRGCPIGCHFCANTNFWHKHRRRSADNVITEIKYWMEKYDVDEIQFADDNLTFNMKKAYELFEKMIPLDLHWCTPNGIMINKVNDDLLEIMHKSGCYQVTLSVDSVDEKTLKERHNKPVRLEKVKSLIDKCRSLGMFTHGTIVVGMPGESIQSINDSLDFILDNFHFTSVSVFIANPIPGSNLYLDMLRENKVTKKDAMMIDTTKLKMKLKGIDNEVLEKIIASYHNEYFEMISKKYPDEINKKYQNVKDINMGKLT